MTKATGSPIWQCKPCIDQFFGTERCHVHNPTPEEREANPTAYFRFQLEPPVSVSTNAIACKYCGWVGTVSDAKLRQNDFQSRGSWSSHVQAICPTCNRYIKNVKQKN